MRLLVVEDDPAMARQLRLALEGAGYVVDGAEDGEEGHFLGDTEPYDAVVLDLGLPKRGGLSVLEQWRQDGQSMPVLILSARDTWREKVLGLRSGADDYLAKPFEMEELLARVEVLVRRGAGKAEPVLACGGLALDAAAGRITLDGAPLTLTALEHRLLAYFLHHAEKVLSKTELTEHIYAYDGDRDSNTIEVLVNRLRKKIGSEAICTHRGRGYQLTDPGTVS
ncbi:response regulator transcription factor [Magnetospira sp. QH-2]|uniref:response regulator transcription factor n=1 Tax=Magnetospira sp. (strain QH-2) TaxID=1288970 RepID=UPI0003E81BE0|nr:response regulator transcription factor [Magnetospira sp. QH-2]CCQ75058.1 putative Two-component response regulator [Magnetospira sp. QH-2]